MARTNNWAIQLSRWLLQSDIWSKPSDWVKIWIYLLSTVNFQDNNDFKRGENFYRYEIIAIECRVSYNTVVKCIKYLKLATQIQVRKTTRWAIISVINYDKYQDLSKYGNTEATQKQDKSKRSTNTITEEWKEWKNERMNNTLVCFEEFWKEYPHKIWKPNAIKKYKEKYHTDIMNWLELWKEYWEEAGTEQRYIPHPATWLNQERWKDEPPEREEKQKSIVLINNL